MINQNVQRYIEVYDNNTDELLESYRIVLPNELTILIIAPDDDDTEAYYSYRLNKEQVKSLGGESLLDLYKNKNVEYHAACYSL